MSKKDQQRSKLVKAPPVSAAELKWLRELAEAVPRFRDAVRAATKGVLFVPNTLDEYMRAAAKVDGALNEIRIAREKK